jgi:hypothetical protein
MLPSDPDFQERDWLTYINHVVKNPQYWFDMMELTPEEQAQLIPEIERAIEVGTEVGFNMAKGVNELDQEDIIDAV